MSFRSDGGIVGLAKLLLLYPAQCVVSSSVHSEAVPVIKRKAASMGHLCKSDHIYLSTIHATSNRPEYRYWLVTFP